MTRLDPAGLLTALGLLVSGIIVAAARYRRAANEGAKPLRLLDRWLDWHDLMHPKPGPPDRLLDQTRAALDKDSPNDDDRDEPK